MLRWPLRILSLFLIPLSVLLWIWFAHYPAYIGYCHNNLWLGLHSGDGTVGTSLQRSARVDGWEHDSSVDDPPLYWPPSSSSSAGHRYRYFAGFGYAFERLPGNDFLYTLFIPYWFIILLTTLLSLLIWHKTRLTPNPRSAFPIDPSPPTTT